MKKYIISVIGLMTIVNAEGIISDTFQTEHPYINNENITQDICVANGYTGPAKVTITGELENNYDFVTISDVDTRFTGVLDENIDVASECVTVHFTTDFSVVKDGITVHIEAEDNGSGNPCLSRAELVQMIAANEDVTEVNTSCITNMYGLFAHNHTFNQDISKWNVSNVTNMSYMFNTAIKFNQDISDWNVSSVTNMDGMLQTTKSFNQNIKNWDVSNVSNHIYFARYSALEDKYNPFIMSGLEIIQAYADNNASNSVVSPNLKNYLEAGISGVSVENLEDVNTMIAHTHKEVIKTAEEIERLVAKIDPSLSRKMLIILMDFEGKTPLPDDNASELFLKNTTDFYLRSSGGKSVLTRAHENYGKVNDGVIRVHLPATPKSDLTKDPVYQDAFRLVDDYIDFSQFDKNGDGYINTETELNIAFIYPYNLGGKTTNFILHSTEDGVRFRTNIRTDYVRFTRQNFLYSRFIHEYGHLMYNFIDLYTLWSHKTKTRQVRGLMGVKTKAGPFNQYYLSAYSHNIMMGDTEEIEEGTVELIDTMAPFYIEGVRSYRIRTKKENEYYYIQNVAGILEVVHVTGVEGATVYRELSTDNDNEIILRYLSNHHEGVENDKKIINIHKTSTFVMQLDIVNNTMNHQYTELLRPLMFNNVVINESPWASSSAHMFFYEWKDIGAEKYGLKIIKHTENNSSEILYENMHLVDNKITLIKQVQNLGKSTIEVQVSAYKDAKWSTKIYYFPQRPEKTLVTLKLVNMQNNEDGGMTFNWSGDSKRYYIFGDGHLLDTLENNKTTFTSYISDVDNYQVMAFDLNGNISSPSTIKNYGYHPHVGILPVAGSKLSSSTVTFNWNDFVPGAHEYGKYKFVISNPKLVNGTIGICSSLNEAECTITGLPTDGTILKAVLIDIVNNERYYFNYISKW